MVKVSKASGTPICLSAIPEGKARNLVVYVHGCCTDAHDVYLLRKEFGDAIKQAFLQYPPSQPDDWEIVVWDWHKNEETGVDQTPKPPVWKKEFYDKANIAYKAADGEKGEGNKLANAINEADANNPNFKYKYIHLIAHSAGSKLIHEAAQTLSKLKNQKNVGKPFIHLTFLDAYTPNDESRIGDDSYGYLPDYPNHYAEHYVDWGLPFTNAILQNAFNFDITGWIGANKGDPLTVGHIWPRYWYIQSMIGPYFYVCGSNSDLVRPCYGYPLSFEGGTNEFNELDQMYPPGRKCFIEVEAEPCEPQ